MSVSKLNHLTTSGYMNCEHKNVRTRKVKQDLYMEKKSQLTTETAAGMFNNTLMWEGRSLVRFMQTYLHISENKHKHVCAHQQVKSCFRYPNLQYLFWSSLNTTGRWCSQVKSWISKQNKTWQKHLRNWLRGFHSATTMTLVCTSLNTTQHLLICLKSLEYYIPYFNKWNSSTQGQIGLCGKQTSRLQKNCPVQKQWKIVPILTSLHLQNVAELPAHSVCQSCFQCYTRLALVYV